MAYDAKINKAKGVEAGSVAAITTAFTSLIFVGANHIMPKLSDDEVSMFASALAILICTAGAALWKMVTNKAKHTAPKIPTLQV